MDDFEPFPMAVAMRVCVAFWVVVGLVVWAVMRGCS
jgi:hypothetical protein